MARPALTEAEAALKGVASKAKVVPLVLVGGRPKCPRTLSKAARKEWLAVVKLLETRSTLDPGAGPTLELYATTKARWLECMARLDKEGLMVTVTKATSKGDLYDIEAENPVLEIAQACEAALQQLTKTLGIAPDAREKVKKVKAVARASAEPAWFTKLKAEVKDGQE